MIIEMQLSTLDKKMDKLRDQTFIVLGMVFLFILFLTLFTWLRIIHPILKVSDALEQISGGHLDVTLYYKRKDEIGYLMKNVELLSLAVRDIEENARSVNPLTGLPGNVSIELKIKNLLMQGVKFCIIYGDLDNFKSYNDYYGISRGDDVLKFTAGVMHKVIREADDPLGFLGHLGGDDFIGICSFIHWENICKNLLYLFDSGISLLYDKKDREKGNIDTVNRQGQPARYPIVTISLAVVTNQYRNLINYAEIANIATEIKKYVKSISGSAYYLDARKS